MPARLRQGYPQIAQMNADLQEAGIFLLCENLRNLRILSEERQPTRCGTPHAQAASFTDDGMAGS
jgi:hypothetical protein